MKNLNIEETFVIAFENHKKNNLQVALDHYNKILKVEPSHFTALNNLGSLYASLGDDQKAIDCYKKVLKINPNYTDTYYNLGIIFYKLKDYQNAKSYYEKAIEIDPSHANSHNNLGNLCFVSGDFQKAKDYYEKAIEIKPDFVDALNNLGVSYQNLKFFEKAKNCYEKAIEINPNFPSSYNNLGNMTQYFGDEEKAKNYYEKAIEINPNYAEALNNLGTIYADLSDNQKAKKFYEMSIKVNPNYELAYWNLHSLTSNIDEALKELNILYKVDNNHIRAKIMISILQGCKGNFDQFNNLLKLPEANHPYVRSAKWVFSLPKLPNIFFNRSTFFDYASTQSDYLRPFYEFGVWNGKSFKYLIKTFKKGFGFDTFTGLPEDWHKEKKGTYSSHGAIPRIEGGEFIVGKFEDTLPKFFLKERPLASLINFDADLYSSTLCALNYSNKVIDEKTILIFDEFIMSDNWEKDEYKALNEFCDNLNISYEVIAVSFFSKQVAIKLKKKTS